MRAPYLKTLPKVYSLNLMIACEVTDFRNVACSRVAIQSSRKKRNYFWKVMVEIPANKSQKTTKRKSKYKRL